MPLIAEPIDQKRWEDFNDVTSWITETQKNLDRISVCGVLDNNAMFYDDEYLGDGNTMFRFNKYGLRNFCSSIGFRSDQLAMIETPSLVSSVLNDLIRQNAIKEKLKDHEFVIDTSKNVIIGIVTKTYVTYTNDDFLTDVNRFLSTLPDGGNFYFQSGFGINTELTVRYVSETIHGEVKGKGGEGPDRSLIGLEFKNSMVGTSSVRTNYFLFRLACANGMMVPAGSSFNRVFHSGNENTFTNRLDQCFKEVFRKIDNIQVMLKSLGEIGFNPQKLAADNKACEGIFEIIPGIKQKICDEEKMHLRYPSESSPEMKRQMQIDHNIKVMNLIPKYIGGVHSSRVFFSTWRESATMFDFLNIFTEKAKTEEVPLHQIEIESRTGALAKYIADNARKF
jgi:hypothetical protein